MNKDINSLFAPSVLQDIFIVLFYTRQGGFKSEDSYGSNVSSGRRNRLGSGGEEVPGPNRIQAEVQPRDSKPQRHAYSGTCLDQGVNQSSNREHRICGGGPHRR